MMDYVTYYDNILSPEMCDKIIAKFENNKSQQETTFLQGHRRFTEINITKQHPDWSDIQNHLLDLIQYNLERYMTQFKIDQKSWPENVGYEQLRLKKYEPNNLDEFAFHVDVGNYASARRFLVYFFYLNDVIEGGYTAFQRNRQMEIEYKVQPKQGRLLMFPPLWTHPHVGMKSISGPKYIIGGYLHYV